MLLYNGQTSNGNGDFVSLNLVGGHLQFRYDLGSGMANITSGPGLVETDKWHRVKITRNGPHGTLQVMFSIIRIKGVTNRHVLVRYLQVNEGPVHSGSSFAPLSELNLETPLYLGGYRYAYSLNR